MTRDELRALLDDIDKEDRDGDYEVAHYKEDDLAHALIADVARGAHGSRARCKEFTEWLRVSRLPPGITRWYA